MDYLNVAVSVLGISGLAGAAYVRFRSDTDNESARLWRENAEAEKARADRFYETIKELTTRVERLEIENGMLRSLVTGERAIADLASMVATQHAEVMGALRGPGASMRAPETRGGHTVRASAPRPAEGRTENLGKE